MYVMINDVFLKRIPSKFSANVDNLRATVKPQSNKNDLAMM